jgi:SAM-dependent methyltransferase
MLDERINKVAVLANKAAYDSEESDKYIDGAPHIKHFALRSLYGKLAVRTYDFASTYYRTPKVLDLGAGEGSVTLPFLDLGGEVTAVDISENQLAALKIKTAEYNDKLKIYCQDVFDAIKLFYSEGKRFDIIIANSFLHHIPDYLELISEAIKVLSDYGQFFSFQDPLKYSSQSRFDLTFSTMAYFSWRVFKGDVIGGIKRRIRRGRGIYLDNCPEDNVEYHAIRGGVDNDAICDLFKRMGFELEIVCYFSTQSRLWQPIGNELGVKNSFAVIARKLN